MIINIDPIVNIVNTNNSIILYSTYDPYSNYGIFDLPSKIQNFNPNGGFLFNRNTDKEIIVEKFILKDMRIMVNYSITIQRLYFEITLNKDTDASKIFKGTILTPHLYIDENGITLYIDVDDITLIRKMKIKKIKSKIRSNDI